MRVGEEFYEFKEDFKRDLERAMKKPVTDVEATAMMARLYRRNKVVRLSKKRLTWI